MYQFTIYNVSYDNLVKTSTPPGRTELDMSKPTFRGSWKDCLNWAKEIVHNLSTGSYILIATSESTIEPQGVWAFTVKEPTVIAIEFGGLKAGIS